MARHTSLLNGTSPHLRGNPLPRPPVTIPERDIPAPAGQPGTGCCRRLGRRGHPRTCGATDPRYDGVDAPQGTSPHLRGNPPAPPSKCWQRRDIPAPAGQPGHRPRPSWSSWGHPRTCGATRSRPGFTRGGTGTSPHLRGNRRRETNCHRCTRDIPAPAGQPQRRTSASCCCKGHPRTCGATQCVLAFFQANIGTSPHLRGNLAGLGIQHLCPGDIPAPAGQPEWADNPEAPPGGHPRTCGATVRAFVKRGYYLGTSPHLRGNRHQVLHHVLGQRDIPAPAGQPATWRPTSTGGSGHPRTCGATGGGTQWAAITNGTSPHLRGNRDETLISEAYQRDIPAPAGQPIIGWRDPGQREGHPRTCGATPKSKFMPRYPTGTSPHLRGNRPCAWRGEQDTGDIPAPAGQPSGYHPTYLFRGGHPRTCGATCRSQVQCAPQGGTSPHLRGNHQYDARRWLAVGDIPAPAGQPPEPLVPLVSITGHPRTCGATGGSGKHIPPASGTSPHLRGNQYLAPDAGPLAGDIPAPAGQPWGGQSTAFSTGGHPRTCGATGVQCVLAFL